MPEFQISDALAREDVIEREAAMRELCSSLSFWKACRGKRCRRVKTCAGDADACFTLHWPWLAVDMGLLLCVQMKFAAAGIERPEIEAEIDRQLRLSRDARATA